MNNISKNLDDILSQIKVANQKSKFKEDITLVAVTKYRSIKEITSVLEYGIKDLGENKTAEFLEKYKKLESEDINWHFIGHLQRNKVKDIVDKVHLIHSVDSLRLLEKINEEAKKKNIKANILLELNISLEESKYGLLENEVEDIIKAILNMENITLKGFMTMAPFTDNETLIKRVFDSLRKIYDKYRKIYNKYDNIMIDTLSMGMSNDYQLAINSGSNMIRVGTSIFRGEI